jgi:regulator of sigma E protease
MELITDFLSTVGYLLLALFILVTFHELGHFLAARLFGMRVDRFSIGFPPRLVGFVKGDTDYCISATPLGGYVKIAGLMDETMDDSHAESEPQPWEYRSKPVWQRMIVISAGVIFNVILAIIIYTVVTFSYGEQVIPAVNVPGVYVAEGSFMHEMGFNSGDKLVKINGQTPIYFRDFFNVSELTVSSIAYTVEREGRLVDIKLPTDFLDKARDEKLVSIIDAIPSEISKVVPSSPADQGGLKPGDKLIQINGAEVGYWVQMTDLIKNAESSLAINVKRGLDTLSLSVTPDPDTKTIGVQMVDPIQFFGAMEVEHGFGTSIATGFQRSMDTLLGIIRGIMKIASGELAIKDNLGGPVAIATVTKEMSEQGGYRGFWEITAFLSLSLAVMNMLPIPVLDGGHLVFLFYEAITRRQPSERIKGIFQQAGFILILVLVVYVTFNDIVRALGL